MSRKKQGGGKRKQALGHEDPHRSCVACRTTADRTTLLRFVRAPDGEVFFDVRATALGRGAWTCVDAGCVRRAVDKGGYARAFDAPCIASHEKLVDDVIRILQQELEAGLGLLRRTGDAVCGHDDVIQQIGRGAVSWVLLAEDVSERTRRDVVTALAAGVVVDEVVDPGVEVPVVDEAASIARRALTGPSMVSMGRALGRDATGVLGFRARGMAKRLRRDASRWSEFVTSAQKPAASRRRGPPAGTTGPTNDDDETLVSNVQVGSVSSSGNASSERLAVGTGED